MKKYLSLYYISIFVTLLFIMITASYISPKLYLLNNNGVNFVINSKLLIVSLVINIILVVVFSIRIIKKKNISSNIIFPICYLVFFVIVLILCFIFNNRILIKYIHFEYYECLILINMLLLNVYSILSIKNK